MPCEKGKTRFLNRCATIAPPESEIAVVLAGAQFRNKGAYGEGVYLPAFT